MPCLFHDQNGKFCRQNALFRILLFSVRVWRLTFQVLCACFRLSSVTSTVLNFNNWLSRTRESQSKIILLILRLFFCLFGRPVRSQHQREGYVGWQDIVFWWYILSIWLSELYPSSDFLRNQFQHGASGDNSAWNNCYCPTNAGDEGLEFWHIFLLRWLQQL